MGKATAFVKKELREMIPPTVFFFVVFETIVVARDLVGAQGGLSMTSTGAAVIGALVVGKAVLIADALPLFHWFRRRLIVNVVWRALLYMLIATLFQFLEEFIPLARERGVSQGFDDLLDEIVWPHFWGTHILLAVFLLFYSFVSATVEVLGRERFGSIFFGTEPALDDGERDASAA